MNFLSPHNVYMKNTHKEKRKEKLAQLLAHFYLPNARLEFDSRETNNSWLSVGATSVQGWRTQQEDAHVCEVEFHQEDQFALFGVFDGHNGKEVAQYAAKMLPEQLKANKSFTEHQYVKCFEETFLEFDTNLLNSKCNEDLTKLRYQANRCGTQSPLIALNTGCTAVVAMLEKSGHFYVANIGDSRCVICHNGKPYGQPLSKDHKPTEEAERHRIERAGCRVVNGRINQGLNLSRAFGDHIMKSNGSLTAVQQAVSALPDVSHTHKKIKPGDFMVLACDGVWNCMSNSEVCSMVRKNIRREVPLAKICERLVERCVSPVRPLNGQLGGDNMTCIIIRFDCQIS